MDFVAAKFFAEVDQPGTYRNKYINSNKSYKPRLPTKYVKS